MSVIKYRENVNAPWQELAVSSVSIPGSGGDLPEEAFTVSGSCIYRFAYGGWDWYINGYGDKVTTKDITEAQYMFCNSKVEEIPFELNFKTVKSGVNLGSMFSNCTNLKSIPKINNCKPNGMCDLFSQCYSLREIPEDCASGFDWSYVDGSTSAYGADSSGMFYKCYSLRSFPMSFLEHGNPFSNYYYGIYDGGFQQCCALDEIVDLPNPHYNATWTGNGFSYTFNECNRLKNMTFKCPDGKPYVVNWKSQTIDLCSYIGYVQADYYVSRILNYNSGITADKEVYDDATYQALKNDADWWTRKEEYSRYNHDSAVATINSLPDASAYLATAGGTNTIKFKGAAGSATDGGAINTLTAEEIAVATAKGWTVTLV